MSLTGRFILILQSVLTGAALVGSLGFYGTVRHDLESERRKFADTRMAWLETGTKFDADDLELELDPGHEPKASAEYWKIATVGGRTLWESAKPMPTGSVMLREKTITLGPPGGTVLADKDLSILLLDEEEEADERKPGKAPGSLPLAPEAKNEPPAVEFTKYGIPEGAFRMKLVLTVCTTTQAMHAELNHLAGALATAVPVGLVLTGLLLTLLVRWQLKPLALMAAEAAKIGPQNTTKRIETPGNAKECVVLRESINSMLARMDEGLQRERRFSAVAAHELRTPVAQLRTNIEVALRRERTVDQYREALTEALTDVERLQNLFSALLQLTRAENGGLAEEGLTPLPAVLGRLRERYPNVTLAPYAGIEETAIRGNEEMVLSAVDNVVDNALKYAPEHPPRVSFVERGGDLEILVEDRGPGIPEGDRERIFEPLMRLDQARTIRGATEGFGLGLSVARSIARAVRGDLTFRSRADGLQRSVFAFRFQKVSPNETPITRERGARASGFSNLDALPAPRPQS